jgi:hypothetical protein
MARKIKHILMRPLVSIVLMNIILNKDKETSIYSLAKKVYGGKPKSAAKIFEVRNLLVREGFVKEYKKIIDGRLVTILKPDFVNILLSLNEILFIEGGFSIGEIKQLAKIFDETDFNMFINRFIVGVESKSKNLKFKLEIPMENLSVVDFFADLFHVLYSFADLPDDFLRKHYDEKFCEFISKMKKLDKTTIKKFHEVMMPTLALLAFDLIDHLKNK